MTAKHPPRLLPALLLSIACTWAGAAATDPDPVPVKTDPLASARAAAKAARWPAAADELRKANAGNQLVNNADWNNLMGYVLRKQSQPDLDAAQKHYDAALRIDPQHKDALEYSGELALLKNDLPTAEARLAALSRLCKSPCEPLDDLKKAIDRYKAGAKS